MKRRDFVLASAAAVAAGTSDILANSAVTAVQPAAVPPSIAALKSMRAQARPITADERRARVEKARRLMTEQKIDALMLC